MEDLDVVTFSIISVNSFTPFIFFSKIDDFIRVIANLISVPSHSYEMFIIDENYYGINLKI